MKPMAARVGVLVGLLVIAFLAYVSLGTTPTLAPGELFSVLMRGPAGDDVLTSIVWNLRLPRACAAILAGGILGLCGAALQSLFRNPLAEPYLVGVSGGAGVGGTLAIALGLEVWVFGLGTMAMAFAGAMLAMTLVLALSKRFGSVSVTRLLVSGVLVGALLASLMTIILVLSGQDSNRILAWLLGSLSTMFWPRVGLMALGLVIAFVGLFPLANQLNAMAASESAAVQLGVDPRRLIRRTVLACSAATGICVGAVGLIGFLGLLAPHLARALVGVDGRRVMPVAALIGALVLLVADLLAQRVVRSLELPVGAVTAVLGAASLILILRRGPERGY